MLLSLDRLPNMFLLGWLLFTLVFIGRVKSCARHMGHVDDPDSTHSVMQGVWKM
jgi:hypothetical protein